MCLHQRVERVAQLGDLAPAKIFVPAVVVQSEDGREPTRRAGRFQKHGFGGRPGWELPGEVLDVQAIVNELMLNLGFGRTSEIGLKQAVLEALSCKRLPRSNFTGPEPIVAK
jgi:hypothetical protein